MALMIRTYCSVLGLNRIPAAASTGAWRSRREPA